MGEGQPADGTTLVSGPQDQILRRGQQDRDRPQEGPNYGPDHRHNWTRRSVTARTTRTRQRRHSVPPPLPRDLPAHLQGATQHRLHLRPCLVAPGGRLERVKSSTQPTGGGTAVGFHSRAQPYCTSNEVRNAPVTARRPCPSESATNRRRQFDHENRPGPLAFQSPAMDPPPPPTASAPRRTPPARTSGSSWSTRATRSQRCGRSTLW
jgi:hypothetical protein